MMQVIASRISTLLLATIGITLAGVIVTFGGALVVLGLLQTANTSSFASAETRAAPLQFVNWTTPPAGRVQNP